MAESKKKPEELIYKGRPIVRRDKTMYYGFIEDKFIVKIVEHETENVEGTEVGTKITVQLTTNNTKLQGNERIIRQSKREGLFDALDIGNVWLEEILESAE